MEQIALPYTLIGPDGATIVLDGKAELDPATSPFRLEDIEGLDSPNIRASVEDIPGDDGAVFNPGYLGSRPLVLSGTSKPSLTVAERNAAMVLLSRASMALRADAILRFQPDGFPAMEVRVRREQPLRFTGRGPVKQFLLPLVAADPRIYSQAVSALSGSTSVLTGAAFDLVFPVNFGGGTGAQREVTVSNAGNYSTPPVIRIVGPITNPSIKNIQTGETLYLDALTLADGQYVDVDMEDRTVTRGDGTNDYDKVRFPGSAWWYLNPGSTIVGLFGTGVGANSRVDVTWRDAWA